MFCNGPLYYYLFHNIISPYLSISHFYSLATDVLEQLALGSSLNGHLDALTVHPSVLSHSGNHREQHINIVNVHSPTVNYLVLYQPVFYVGQVWCMQAAIVRERPIVLWPKAL